MISHVKITTASLVALATTIVGALCATVPQIAADKQLIIAALTAVITTAGLIANSIHALAGAKVSTRVLEQDLQAAVQKELKRVLTAASDPRPIVAVPDPPPAA